MHKKRWHYKDIAEDAETKFDNPNYELNRLLPKRKNKKVIGVMKDELGGIIMKEFVELTEKTYSYLTDDSSEYEKPKENLNLKIIKTFSKQLNWKTETDADNLKKDYTEIIKKILKTQERFKS